jgi:thiol-disulfide isomerase/thioredoxin
VVKITLGFYTYELRTINRKMSGEAKSEGVGKSGEGGMKTIGILAIGLIIGVIIGVVVGAFGFPQTQSSIDANILTADKAGEKVAAFINNNLVQPGTQVTLGEVREESGLYNVTTSYMENQIPVYITKDGEIIFLQGLGWVQIEEFEEQKKQRENQTQEQERKQETTIGNFIINGDALCAEDGKSIIYFFGSTGCPACEWEHPIVANVTSKFEGYISFHDNIIDDSTVDREIFAKYSDGRIPTLVLGCNYYRVGAGVTIGEDQEAKVLTALICKLTDNKPAEVCTDPEIEALINQIE